MRKTILDIQKMKARGERIPMLTAYDYPIARLLDAAGVGAGQGNRHGVRVGQRAAHRDTTATREISAIRTDDAGRTADLRDDRSAPRGMCGQARQHQPDAGLHGSDRGLLYDHDVCLERHPSMGRVPK